MSAPIWILCGSGGKYDGVLGGVETIRALRESGVRLKNPVEVIGFCDEEVARFHSTFLGGKAVTVTLENAELERKDHAGVTVRQALKSVGHLEVILDASNVNPAGVWGFLDVRNIRAQTKKTYLEKLFGFADGLEKKEKVTPAFRPILEAPPVACSPTSSGYWSEPCRR